MFSNLDFNTNIFHGLTSEILDLTSVRGHAAGNLIHHLVFFGTALGRYPHIFRRQCHFPALNAVLIAPTASGKGESLSVISELYGFGNDKPFQLAPTKNTCLTSGKKTIQLISDILDASDDGENRFLSIDEECSAQLKASNIWNNTLYEVLIKLIDGREITESVNRRTLELPPLNYGSIGHITPISFLQNISEGAVHNGSANRFLYIGFPETEFSENDGVMDENDLARIQEEIIISLDTGGERERIALDDPALSRWQEYMREMRGANVSTTISALQNRMNIIALKLALVLGLVNREEKISAQSMDEALYIIDYSRSTLQALYPERPTSTPDETILQFLNSRGEVSKTELSQGLTSQLPKAIIDNALKRLIQKGRLTKTVRTVARGRRPTYYSVIQ